VAISNAVDPSRPTSLADARHRDATWDVARYHLARYVADDGRGQVVGWGQVAHMPWQYHPRKYDLRLEVMPEHRRRGVGSALFVRLLAELHARDALLVRAGATEGDAESIGFLTQRGFREIWRTLHSRLDVAAFDPAPFADAAERVARQGVSITTLAAELARDTGVLREVYDLYVTCARDQQEIDAVTPPTFAKFVAHEIAAPQAIAEAWCLARKGECIVGLSTLEQVTGATDVAECGYTAVHPAYRGRGIALALKLRAIAYARDHAYRSIQTNSNAGNERMLQINAALGFQPLPAHLTFELRLA
jgi:GNAT superfamily N-acetyltransferase